MKFKSWFTCERCGWKGIRHVNQKYCPQCRQRRLARGKSATKEECVAAFNEAAKKYKLPEPPEVGT